MAIVAMMAILVLVAQTVRADTLWDYDYSTLAATVFEDKPIIVFSAFDGLPGFEDSELVVATCAVQAPRYTRDWTYHKIRQDLRSFPDETNIQNLAFTKAGSGLALSILAWPKGQEAGTLVAWTPHYPRSSDDWQVTRTGFDFMDIATIAGSDTYIALGTIAQGTDGAVLLKVECAALPFPTTNTCWIKADVPIILSTDIVDNTNNCFVSSLSLDIVGSRLYAAARVNTSSGDVIVLGECTNPISDLKHWKFTELHSGRGDSVFLSAEDSRLCLVCNDYGESDSSILYIGTCEACASSSPAAWRWCQTSFECSLLGSTMYYQNGLAIAYGWMNQTAGLFALDTDLYANTTTEPTRITTPIPGIEKFASVMNIQDKPAVASFDCGDPGRVVYAWSDKAIPHRKSDWHLCTVYEGKASGIVDPQPVVEGDGWLVQAVTSWRVWIFALSLCIVIFGVLAAIHKARRRKAAAKPARQ